MNKAAYYDLKQAAVVVADRCYPHITFVAVELPNALVERWQVVRIMALPRNIRVLAKRADVLPIQQVEQFSQPQKPIVGRIAARERPAQFRRHTVVLRVLNLVLSERQHRVSLADPRLVVISPITLTASA